MPDISVIIVDDEPLARSRIRDLLAKTGIVPVAECTDGDEAVNAIGKLKPDLVFLDVQMPEKSGFDVIAAVGAENMPVVVFVTAFDKYALKAFEVHALDYLMKPFEDERFFQTWDRAVERIRGKSQISLGGEYREMLSALVNQNRRKEPFPLRFLVRSNERMTFLAAVEIEWIRAEGNYVCMFAKGNSYRLRETISNIENSLDPSQFLRINRSTIVNVEMIREMHQMFHGDYRVILKDSTQFPLSRRYRGRLPRIVELR